MSEETADSFDNKWTTPEYVSERLTGSGYYNTYIAYRRPVKGFAGMLSKPLGAMTDWVRIDPTKEALMTVPRLRLAALGLVSGAIGLLVALGTFGPSWLMISPLELYSNLYRSVFGDGVWFWVASTATFVLLLHAFQYGMVGAHRYEGRLIDRLAMHEEQWFRNGAEHWSWPQRVYSCFAFGIVHIANIFYPIGSLLVLGVVGAVFMRYYLKVYRRTHDSRYATLAAAKLHATYNRWAFLYLLAVIGVTIWQQ